MGRSKETFGKKDVRNKKEKKRKEKEKKRLEKKELGKTKSFDDMIAYVDENGVISSTPPDPNKKEDVDIENIEISVPKAEFREEEAEKLRKGKVTNFDQSKGYGFIFDSQTRESLFVHINDCIDEIKGNDTVSYEVEKGPKGLKAVQVKNLSV